MSWQVWEVNWTRKWLKDLPFVPLIHALVFMNERTKIPKLRAHVHCAMKIKKRKKDIGHVASYINEQAKGYHKNIRYASLKKACGWHWLEEEWKMKRDSLNSWHGWLSQGSNALYEIWYNYLCEDFENGDGLPVNMCVFDRFEYF